eukprot:TRINITY_DN2379_c0_g2_i2.p1 TRINITY_DN2379_c0_g2~~TRINITY_DN2379_c0_g2_i2.p1  ORF type:complete len:141 (+),score=11.21 TRINITY_DN2379_c0_g2_i2:104-526(+)
MYKTFIPALNHTITTRKTIPFIESNFYSYFVSNRDAQNFITSVFLEPHLHKYKVYNVLSEERLLAEDVAVAISESINEKIAVDKSEVDVCKLSGLEISTEQLKNMLQSLKSSTLPKNDLVTAETRSTFKHWTQEHTHLFL